MKKLIPVFIALALFSTGSLYAGSKTVMGYLSDVKCATSPNGVSADGANLAVNPDKHTAACMKMGPCEASGYGVFIQDASGKYVFTKFDKKGSDLAKAYLKKTKKKDGLIIDVTGTMEGKIFKVEKISEGSMDMKM